VRAVNEKVQEYFIAKGELFRLIMDSTIMMERGKKLARGIARQLMILGCNKGRVLDVGCGTGRVAIPLAEMGFNVVGIDISPTYIDIANRRARERNVEDRTSFIVCDARDMETCTSSYKPFSAVLFVWSSVIGYYDESTDSKIFSEAYNISTDRAALIIADAICKEYMILHQYLFGMTKKVYEYDNTVVMERLLYNPATGNVMIKQEFYEKRQGDLMFIGDAHFELHLYSLDELNKLANKSGWCLYKVLTDLDGEVGYSPFTTLNAVFVKCKK
jgi:SAM-dependent methyltransferase